MIDKTSGNWQALPLWLKCWFFLSFLDFRPTRQVAKRVEAVSHPTGFIFCLLGLASEAALVGGLIMLSTAYLFHVLAWQGDNYGIWYDAPNRARSGTAA